MHELFVGIDVSKGTRLMCTVRPSGESITLGTAPAGLHELVERVQAWGPALIVLEATGGYGAWSRRRWRVPLCPWRS